MSDDMSHDRESAGSPARNPWKLATLALAGGVAALCIAFAVTAAYNRGRTAGEQATAAASAAAAEAAKPSPAASETQRQAAAPAPAPPRTAAPARTARAAQPTAADVEACNSYASRSRTTEGAKGALLGGALGAALGAAGGAIADGGHGAGKGAAIGALVGVTGGTLYGINRANQANAQAQAAYRDCMERRGFASAAY